MCSEFSGVCIETLKVMMPNLLYQPTMTPRNRAAAGVPTPIRRLEVLVSTALFISIA